MQNVKLWYMYTLVYAEDKARIIQLCPKVLQSFPQGTPGSATHHPIWSNIHKDTTLVPWNIYIKCMRHININDGYPYFTSPEMRRILYYRRCSHQCDWLFLLLFFALTYISWLEKEVTIVIFRTGGVAWLGYKKQV